MKVFLNNLSKWQNPDWQIEIQMCTLHKNLVISKNVNGFCVSKYASLFIYSWCVLANVGEFLWVCTVSKNPFDSVYE